MITTLSQLKKQLTPGAEFDIVDHCQTKTLRERRRVTHVNTTGFYMMIPTDPDGVTSNANGGKGSFLGWKDASFWEFRDDGVCVRYFSGNDKSADNLAVAFKFVKGD